MQTELRGFQLEVETTNEWLEGSDRVQSRETLHYAEENLHHNQL